MPGAAPSRPRSRRALPRVAPALVASLVAVVLLFGQLSALAHRALVAHVRCAHGELVHVDREDAGPRSAPDAAGFNRGTAGAADHDHDHCGAAAFLSSSWLPAASHPASAPAAALVARAGVLPTRTAASLAVYAFAPKTSPPAAA
jgi:hypothetical protein